MYIVIFIGHSSSDRPYTKNIDIDLHNDIFELDVTMVHM